MTTSLSAAIARYMLVPIAAVWVFHLAQRRSMDKGIRKRNATLYLTLVLLAAWALVWLLAKFSLDNLYLVPIGFFTLAVLVWQRAAIFPFHARCARCGLPLTASRIMFDDSNTCETCEPLIREGENQ